MRVTGKLIDDTRREIEELLKSALKDLTESTDKSNFEFYNKASEYIVKSKFVDELLLDQHRLIDENNKLKSQIIELKDKLYQIREKLNQ